MRHHHFSAASTKYFERTSGHFPVMFVPTISDIFYVTSGQLLAYYILYYGANKIRHFKLKHDLFQSLTKYFLCLNLTRPQAQNCHNTNWKCKVLKLKSSTFLWFAGTCIASIYCGDWVVSFLSIHFMFDQ